MIDTSYGHYFTVGYRETSLYCVFMWEFRRKLCGDGVRAASVLKDRLLHSNEAPSLFHPSH